MEFLPVKKAKEQIGKVEIDECWDEKGEKEGNKRFFHATVYRDEKVLRVANRTHGAPDGDRKTKS